MVSYFISEEDADLAGIPHGEALKVARALAKAARIAERYKCTIFTPDHGIGLWFTETMRGPTKEGWVDPEKQIVHVTGPFDGGIY